MAMTLQLSGETYDVSVNMALASYLIDEEWAPSPIPKGDGWFDEVLPMVIKQYGSDTTIVVENYMEVLRRLENLLRQAKTWKEDKFRSRAVWLEWQPDGANAQRAVVGGGYVQALVGATNSPHLRSGQPVRFNLVLERGPWENALTTEHGFAVSDGTWFMPSGPPTYAGDMPTIVSGTGGTLAVEQGGTAPGRIKELVLRFSAGNIISAWVGIRPITHDPDTTTFTPVWEAEIGVRGTQVSLVSADATCSNSKCLRTTFLALNDPDDILYRISNVGPTGTEGVGADVLTPDFWGRYVVLLRYRLPSAVGGEVFGVTLEHGVVNKVPLDEVIIEADYSAGGWNVMEMGEVEIPGIPLRNDYQGNMFYSFDIQLQQIAGTLTPLDIDCLLLVPAQHMARFDGANVTGSTDEIAIITAEDGEVTAVQRLWEGDEILYILNPEARNWYMPREGGIVVVVTTNSASFPAPVDIDDEVGLGLELIPRWSNWRGNG